jgi:transcriptional regulator
LVSEEHVSSESGLAEVHSLREKAVREDIARRLGQVCANFSQDEFDALVAIMAARQVKCERRPIW